jgi:methanogenic corrinoid protein MtbC1
MTSVDPAGERVKNALDRYLAAQLAGNAALALQQLNDLIDAGHEPAEVRTRVVQQAQLEIGRLWQSDRITVAQEHAATAIGQVALSHLFGRSAFSARRDVPVVVACVPGELHDFPARMVADELEIAGFDVTFLGTDVAEPVLVERLVAIKPRLLALSVTMFFNCDALRRTMAAVRAACPGLAIAVGGGGLRECLDPATDFGADVSSASPQDLVARLIRGELQPHG